jgi:hypothetical protein
MFLRFFTVVVCVALSVAFVSTERALPQREAPELLAKARAAIGGEEALARVTGLAFKLSTLAGARTSPHVGEHGLLLPDKYVQSTPTRASFIAARDYWSVPVNPAMAEVNQIHMRRQLARWAIILLVPKPELLGMTARERRGVRPPGSLPLADVVTFEGADQFTLDLFLDPETGHPVGYSWPFWTDRIGAGWFAARFDGYSEIDGVRFPSTIEARYGFDEGPGTLNRSTITDLVTNPPGLEGRFRRH